MAKEVIMIKCPLCGWNHPPIRKGSKRLLRGEAIDSQPREFNFERVSLEEDPLISIRLAEGKGKGFRLIGKITLQEACQKNLVPELIISLKNQCQKILDLIG